jgi:SIR2-like domain
MDTGIQTLKSRDDKEPVIIIKSSDGADQPEFKLAEGITCSWAKPDQSIGVPQLRERIEPWLTALFQSEHFALLVGSGLTHAVHRMATGRTLPWMAAANFQEFDAKIAAAAKISADRAARREGNIEDQIRVANELLLGLEILAGDDEKVAKQASALKANINAVLENFAAEILKAESGLINADDTKREPAFNYLVSFLMSFASRTGTRDRLQIFTTNYDRYIEAGAEVSGLHLLDRFVGSLAPIFRSSRLDVDMHYNPPGIRGEPRYLEGVAKFTKLHGSMDWVYVDRSIRRIALPFGVESIDPYLTAPGLDGANAQELMIYPNSAKDRETASYPYVELFRDFAAAICRPNSTLVAYGYSFGDEHLNRVIEDMLTIPSTHLVVISYSDPLGRIMDTYKRMGRYAQVTLLLGDHLGDFETLIDNYLPKPAIDRNTIRMSELLKSRWGTSKAESAKRDDNQGVEGTPEQ